jgi:hypothetical protein
VCGIAVLAALMVRLRAGKLLLPFGRKGQVTVLRVSLDLAADATLVAPLAREFDAHVYADDGTRYA